jgi:hypothetical protein
MDEAQFRDILKMMDEHNKASLNCFMDGIKQIVEASIRTQDDHDILIEMNSNLKNHLERCEENKKSVKCHIQESVNIRDDVKKNSGFRLSATKALWVAYAAIIGLIGRILFWK